MAKRSAIVPEAKAALDQMKYELAGELGLISQGNTNFDSEFADELGGAGSQATNVQAGTINWSAVSTRNVGYIGGSITKRLIQQAEKVLGNI